MRIALIVIFVIAAGVLITVIAASEAISVAAAFMEFETCCGNCKYHVHDDNGDGMCVNADSDACADWTDDSDICGKYAEKGDKRNGNPVLPILRAEDGRTEGENKRIEMEDENDSKRVTEWRHITGMDHDERGSKSRWT